MSDQGLGIVVVPPTTASRWTILRRIKAVPWFAWGWSGRRYRPGIRNFLFVNFPRSLVRSVCETRLITRSGHRNTFEVDTIERLFGVWRRYLDALVDATILRKEFRYETEFYELSHDTMVGTLLGRRRLRVGYNFVIAVVLVLVAVNAPRLAVRGVQNFYQFPHFMDAGNVTLGIPTRAVAIRELSITSCGAVETLGWIKCRVHLPKIDLTGDKREFEL